MSGVHEANCVSLETRGSAVASSAADPCPLDFSFANLLGCLALIRDPSQLHGTPYMELAAGDFAGKPRYWQPGSLFIDESGFTYLHNVSQRAHPQYDFNANTRFDDAHLGTLIAELEGFVTKLKAVNSLADLRACFSSHIGERTIRHGPAFAVQSAAIAKTATGVLEYVRQARNDHQCVWLLGI